jgi:glutaredoxin/glutathione-dependent peroxiredoxin
MTIKVGDRLPEGKLAEFIETATEGCSLGPNTFNVADLVKGKKIALFGLPGAFTPTCSKATGTVRMMGDGNADFAKALGLDADFSKFGMGTRSQRYSMLIDDGVVSQLNVEQGGTFEVSDAKTLLAQLG